MDHQCQVSGAWEACVGRADIYGFLFNSSTAECSKSNHLPESFSMQAILYFWALNGTQELKPLNALPRPHTTVDSMLKVISVVLRPVIGH